MFCSVPDARRGLPEHIDGERPMSRAGFIVRNVRRLKLEGVEVSGQEGEPFVFTEFE